MFLLYLKVIFWIRMFLMLIGTGVVISVLLDVLDDFVVLRDLKNK